MLQSVTSHTLRLRHNNFTNTIHPGNNGAHRKVPAMMMKLRPAQCQHCSVQLCKFKFRGLFKVEISSDLGFNGFKFKWLHFGLSMFSLKQRVWTYSGGISSRVRIHVSHRSSHFGSRLMSEENFQRLPIL